MSIVQRKGYRLCSRFINGFPRSDQEWYDSYLPCCVLGLVDNVLNDVDICSDAIAETKLARTISNLAFNVQRRKSWGLQRTIHVARTFFGESGAVIC